MRSMFRFLVCVAFTALFQGLVVAQKCDIKDGATDWTSNASYDGGQAPGAGDEVRVLDGRTVYLNASMDSASLSTYSSLK